MSGWRRTALFVGWVGVIALLSVYVQRELHVSGDLRLFMPSPQTRAEKLLLDEVGESPSSRLLLLAFEGSDPETLANSSQELAAALRDDPAFGLVANGSATLDAIPESFLAYRYLLSPTLDDARFDATYLRGQLEERLQDLSSPAAALLESLIPRDPTLEVVKLAEEWQPSQQPQRLYDVWFDRAGDTALMLIETSAAAFDPDGQSKANSALLQHFEETRTDPHVTLTVSGPGAFSLLMKERTQREAQWLGVVATVGLILLMLVAYRSPSLVVLGALPLASAAIAGLTVVSVIFGSVHGITLAFGITLIGVAQDYPLHLFSHQHPGAPPLVTARHLWPTLATGVVSTCIAYLALLYSGVVGLAQLACFTIVGLAVAGLTTRYLLPRLVPSSARDYGDSQYLARLWSAISALPRPKWFGAAVVAACLAVIVLGPAPFWQNDLSRLTPVPQELLDTDSALRKELNAPDARYLLLLEGSAAEDVLRGLEALTPKLEALARAGDISGFDHAARYLPSVETQKRRQAALPARDDLQASLTRALEGLPFKAGLFTPFLDDVASAHALEPLTTASVAKTPLELRVGSLLTERSGHWAGLVTLAGARSPAVLEKVAEESNGTLTLLDLKQASENLVARQRDHIIWSLAIAAVLLVVAIFVSLRSVPRMLRVVTPMAITTVLILAILHGAGISLNLFHLIGLVLAAGLGVDYALFFEAAAEEPLEQRRTLHAVLVCSLATLMVFVLLAFSTLPVLRAIGITVALGVASNFVLALLLTRPSPGRSHARA